MMIRRRGKHHHVLVMCELCLSVVQIQSMSRLFMKAWSWFLSQVSLQILALIMNGLGYPREYSWPQTGGHKRWQNFCINSCYTACQRLFGAHLVLQFFCQALIPFWFFECQRFMNIIVDVQEYSSDLGVCHKWCRRIRRIIVDPCN